MKNTNKNNEKESEEQKAANQKHAEEMFEEETNFDAELKKFNTNKQTQKSNFELRKEAEIIKNSKEGRNFFVQLFESRKQIIEDYKNSNK